MRNEMVDFPNFSHIYVSSVFIPYISKQYESATRVDVVWDTYITSNIKESTRDKSGKGKQREVTTQ